ncbi:uncharacterized protein LOC141903414 [Tubulanus polymorphus]|uniref:uncharacterized protein LOC141903414 n=1 Tax=Tubulanus polymorphus TaxID=672921 RepID=UPI003DA286FF
MQRSVDSHTSGRLSEICRILRRALFDDDIKALKAVCRNTVEPDLIDNEGNSPLHMAARMGRRKCLKWLLENTDLPVMAFNSKGQTCAHEAAQQGHYRCLKEAINHGMSHPGFITKKDDDGMTVLHVAVCKGEHEPIQWLVTKYGGVLVPMKNNDGQNVLHIAAAIGNVELIRFLYSADRKILNDQDNCGATVIHYAAYHGQLDAIKYLIDSVKANIRILTHRNESCLHIAAYGGYLDIVRFLLKRVDEVLIWSLTTQGGNIFHFAAACGSVEVIKHLMKRSPVRASCECTVADKTGNTPVHEAAAGGHSNTIKYFWGIGLDISMENKLGETPYSIAVIYEYFSCAEMIKSLLRAQGKEPHAFSSKNRQKLLGDDKRRRWTINSTASSKRSQKIYNKSKGKKWKTGGRSENDRGEFNRRLSVPETPEQSDFDILSGELYFRPNDEEVDGATKSSIKESKNEAYGPSKTLALQRIFLPVKNGSFSSKSFDSIPEEDNKGSGGGGVSEDENVGEFKLQSSTRFLSNGNRSKLSDPYNGESPVVERIQIHQKFSCSPSPESKDEYRSNDTTYDFRSPLLDRANFLDIDSNKDSRHSDVNRISNVAPFSNLSDDSLHNIPSTDYDDSDGSKTASYDLLPEESRKTNSAEKFDPTAELDAVLERSEAECVHNSFSSNHIASKTVQSKYYFEDFDIYGGKSNSKKYYQQHEPSEQNYPQERSKTTLEKVPPSNDRGKPSGKVRLQISDDGLDFYELVRRSDDDNPVSRRHTKSDILNRNVSDLRDKKTKKYLWSDLSDNGYGSISESTKMAALPSVCTVCRGSGKPDSTVSVVDDNHHNSSFESQSSDADGKIISCTLVIDGQTYTMSATDDPKIKNLHPENRSAKTGVRNSVSFNLDNENVSRRSVVPLKHGNTRTQRLRSIDRGDARKIAASDEVDSVLSSAVQTPDLYIHYTIYKRNSGARGTGDSQPEVVEATV